MKVKDFDSLILRDFENGAVRDEIRRSLKQLENIKPPAEVERAIRNFEQQFVDWEKTNVVGFGCLFQLKQFANLLRWSIGENQDDSYGRGCTWNDEDFEEKP